MPLFFFDELVLKSARLSVWNGTETTAELADFIAADARAMETFSSIKLEKRKREWLITYTLLKHLSLENVLAYLPSGKPTLTNGRGISISHCNALAAIVYSPSNVGMDVQCFDEKLGRIREKFCNAGELEFLDGLNDPSEALTIIWSAKEAVFKFYGEQVDFANDIRIAPFHPYDNEISAHYSGTHGDKDFALQHFMIEKYHVVIAS